jgi:hypothetical protein
MIGRTLLAELEQRLSVLDWQTRRDDRGVIMIAGSRGTVKPTPDGLVVLLRPQASLEVQDIKRQLIRDGLLAIDCGGLVFARMPNGAEASLLRQLLGLHGRHIQ